MPWHRTAMRGLWVAVVFSCATTARADDIDRFIVGYMQRQHIPAVSLAIIRHGRLEDARGFGLADLERNVPASTDTVFEIGSITKQFTATAILLLAERGRLSLSDELDKHLPGLPEAWRAITIRQLLTHTSGIPDYEAVMGYDSYRNVMSPEQVIALVSSRPLDFPPGTKWSYSNTGYFLLTQVLEGVTREKYAEFVERNVLAPAGMSDTRSSEPTDVIANRAAGYEYRSGAFHNRDAMQPSATGGAGMLVSTARDLARWVAFLAKQSLLEPESYAAMWADTRLADGTMSGYGFGWFVTPMRGHRALSHSGGTAGFTANLLYLPDDDVAVIALLNRDNADPIGITDHIARVLVPTLRYAPIPDARPDVARRLQDFFAHRTDTEIYSAPLTPELATRLAPYWSANVDYFRTLGPPLATELVEVVGESSFRYRVRYRDIARIVFAALDDAGKIREISASED